MIEVTHYYGIHQSGTKDYHLYLLGSKRTNRHLLIKRWGKTASEGQSKVEMGSGLGEKQLDAALRDRAKSGYDMRHEPVRYAPGKSLYDTAEEALQANLPRSVMRSLSNAQVALLDPDHDGGTAGTYDPMSNDRARLRQKMEMEANEADARRRAQEDAEAEELLKQNPLYGMF